MSCITIELLNGAVHMVHGCPPIRCGCPATNPQYHRIFSLSTGLCFMHCFFIATLISIAQWYTVFLHLLYAGFLSQWYTVFFIVISTFHSSESHNFYYGYPSTAPEYPLQLISIAPQPPAFHNCVIFQDCRLLVENLTVLFAAVIKKFVS